MKAVLGAFSAFALQVAQVQAVGKLWGDLRPTSYDKGDYVDIHVG